VELWGSRSYKIAYSFKFAGDAYDEIYFRIADNPSNFL